MPFSLLLDAGAALRAEDVGSVFAAVKPALDAVDNRLPLALFMLHELRKPDSFWRPYFGVCTPTPCTGDHRHLTIFRSFVVVFFFFHRCFALAGEPPHVLG